MCSLRLLKTEGTKNIMSYEKRDKIKPVAPTATADIKHGPILSIKSHTEDVLNSGPLGCMDVFCSPVAVI